MTARGRIGLGGTDPFAAAHAGDTGGTHVPGYLVAAHVVTGSAGGFP